MQPGNSHESPYIGIDLVAAWQGYKM